MKQTFLLLLLMPCLAFAQQAQKSTVQINNSGSEARFSPVNKQSKPISLKGTWNFIPAPDPDYYKNLDVWADSSLQVPVPSQLNRIYEPFFKRDLKTAGLYKSVFIPQSWKGKRVKLRLQTLEGDADLYVNQQFVGRSAGVYIPREIDITETLKFGEPNVIAYYATNEAPVIRSISRGYLGMTYAPKLIALPEVNISSLHVETHFDKSYEDANLVLQMEVTNESMRRSEAREIKLDLTDPNGDSVALSSPSVSVSAIPAGETKTIRHSLPVDSPLKWIPENPHLYSLSCKLVKDGSITEEIKENVGFREVQIKGQQVFLNGEQLKVTGIGYHDAPNMETHHAMSRDDFLQDLKMFKYANVNMVRAWPFHDLANIADSLGLMLSLETPVGMLGMTWMPRLDGVVNDSSFVRDYLQNTRQKIEAFRNHPSVIVWSLGNESEFREPAFVKGGFLTQRLDSTREVWAEAHESERLGHNLPQTTIDNFHYPNLETSGLPEKRPMFYGEWAHTHEYNKDEFYADPGIRDFWVHDYEAHLDYMYNRADVLGGYLFYSLSFILKTNNGMQRRDWGILDPWRRPKPEFWNVKKANSPLRLTSHKIAVDGKSVRLNLQSRFNFSNTREMSFQAFMNDKKIKVENPAIAPRSKGVLTIALPKKLKQTDKIRLDVRGINGRLIDRYEIRKPLSVEKPDRPEQVSLQEKKNEWIVQGKTYRWEIDKTDGLIDGGFKNETPIVEHGPLLTMTPHHARESKYGSNWKLESLRKSQSDDGVTFIAAGSYDEAEGSFTYSFKSDGHLQVDTDFTWTKKDTIDYKNPKKQLHTYEMRELGVAFALPDSYQQLNWKKESLWSYYPSMHIGRSVGEATAFPIQLPDFTRDSMQMPWPLVTTKNGSNDFRSTKTNIHKAGLSNSRQETALTAYSDGTQSSRSYYGPENQQNYLVVMNYYGGGFERFLHAKGIFTYPRKILDEGSEITGSYTFYLE